MTDATSPDDPALLARALAGNSEAFGMIFARHGPAVRRFLGNAFRNGADADEATQETFLRAQGRLSAVRDPARLRAWLLGVARIVMLDTLSQQKREVVSQDPALAQTNRENPSARDATPEAELLSAEAEAVLAAELATLAVDRRAAVMLRLDQHLPYAEIAGIMGWTLQKVKNEIHRARQQIRARLLDYLEGTR